MDIYIENVDEKQLFEHRYKIFFKNPKYLYLVQNDPIDVVGLNFSLN